MESPWTVHGEKTDFGPLFRLARFFEDATIPEKASGLPQDRRSTSDEAMLPPEEIVDPGACGRLRLKRPSGGYTIHWVTPWSTHGVPMGLPMESPQRAARFSGLVVAF